MPHLDDPRRLSELLAAGPWDLKQSLLLVRRLAVAVQTLHESGQLHRAVDADHVLIDARGLSRLERPPRLRRFGGDQFDPDVCPPELAGRPVFEVPCELALAATLLETRGCTNPKRIDVYQLGTLFCRLLTGNSVRRYLYSPTIKGAVPSGARCVLDQALAFDTQTRFQDCAQMAAAIEALLEAEAARLQRGAETVAAATDDAMPSSIIPRAELEAACSAASAEAGRGTPDRSAAPFGGQPDPPFSRLGTCRVLERLGRGGMGDVFKAYDDSLGRTVAIKALPPELARHPEFVARFQVEASAVAKLMHPNVVQIYSIGEEQGHHFFVMQFVEGESLAARLARDGRLKTRDAVAIAEQCLSGLVAAHDEGLVHRDIKPANVLLERKTGRALLADFGLVKAASQSARHTATGVIMGTVDYISPEQGRGLAVDGRSDLYSLGVMLYEMLTGRSPFQSQTPTGMIFQHAYEEPRPLRDVAPCVPAELEAIVGKLMKKLPEQRYQTAGEALLDLAAFRRGSHESAALAVERASVVITPPPDLVNEPAMPAGWAQVPRRWPAWRSRLLTWFERWAPAALQELRSTSQQVDGAIVIYQQRTERLRQFLVEAQAVAAELGSQIELNVEGAMAAMRRAEAATSEEEEKAALEEKHGCEENMAGLKIQCEQQKHEISAMEKNLNLAETRLAELQSHRELLHARLKTAQARLRLAGSHLPARRIWRRPIVAGAVSGAALLGLACIVVVSRTRADVLSTLAVGDSIQLEGHTDLVMKVAFSPGMDSAITASYDQSVCMWGLPSGERLYCRLHEGVVWGAAYSPVDEVFVSGAADGAIHLWNIKSGAELRSFVGHTAKIANMRFSPDGSQLVSSSEDSTVRIWDVAAGTQRRAFHAPGTQWDVAFLPDGNRVVSCGGDAVLRIWDVAAGRQAAEFASGDIVGLASLVLVDKGRRAVVGTAGNDMLIFDLTMPGKPPERLRGHTASFVRVAASADASRVISGSADGTIRVWDLDMTKQTAVLQGPRGVQSIAISPDGQFAITGHPDGAVQLWRLPKP
ncbi:MAG: protein kinase [Pirellulales bacterium]